MPSVLTFLTCYTTEVAASRAFRKPYLFFCYILVKNKELLYFVRIYLCYNSFQTFPSLLLYWMSWFFPTFLYSTYLSKHAFSILHAVFKVWPIGLTFPHVCFHKLIDSPVQNLIFQQGLPFSNRCHSQSTIHREVVQIQDNKWADHFIR